MAGATLMKICYEIYDMNKVEKRQLPNYAFNLGKILRLYQYTGYQLTIEGSNIYKRFRRNEIDNLKVLLDRKYWVKSIPYHYEIISIEDWVRICERLQIRGRKVDTTRKERILRASKDIATGLIECGNCGKRYYYHEQKAKRNKDGDVSVYLSYFHISTINGRICNQRPRSFKLDDINEIFKLFYFYFYMVFDNTNDLIKESQRNIKHIQLKLYDFYSEIVKDAGFIDTLWNNDDFIEVQGDTISRGGSRYTNYNDSMKQLFMRIYFRDRSKSERWNYGRYKIERIKRINKEGVESAEYFRKTIENGEDLNFKVWNVLCNSVDRVCGVSIGNLIWWYCFMIETEVKIELLGRGKVVYNVFDGFYYDVNDKDIKDEIRELLNEKTVIIYDKYMKCIRL
jgi:hypothetical protein